MISHNAVFIVFALLVGLAIGLLGAPMLDPAQPDPTPTPEMAHDHAAHDHGEMISLPAGDSAPRLDFMVMKDAAGGWNLHIQAENFQFTPASVNQANVPGQGHAHIYVNGEKLARVYGPWFHIASLPDGAKVNVTLNANDHSTLAVDDVPLSLTKTLPEG